MTLVNLGYITLNDGFPGAINPNRSVPTDGWDNTVDNITTTSSGQTPPVPVGTKVMAYSDNPHAPGFYTMQYLMFHDYSSAPINATDYSINGAWCAHCDISDAEKYTTDFSAVPWYVVSKCYTAVSSDITQGFPVALPCATLDGDGSAAFVTGYGDAYGWFWVGGVCPLDDVSHFRGQSDTSQGFDFSTDTLMRNGPIMACMSAAWMKIVNTDLSDVADATASIGLSPYAFGHACTSSA